ncbi:hypothetical protein ERX46_08540 [Brumimicrobium glaciale]|uniref:Lipoprotein n=1 Tax=Brumimicrobium glaciale TaxID=200475 RepID=A0A4Q4KNJ8_9FLAO|nr:hypothetical protein [Brumimicrobium glaciale]RYM34004.1 hypothetical protein ERX46_08540 [Brumimicrobium glaciale]
MKKSILVLTVLLGVFVFATSSCKKDEVEAVLPPTVEVKGSYEVYLDGVLFKEATNAEVGLIKDAQGNYVNTVNIGMGSNFSIVVSGFPRAVNGVENNDSDSDPGVSITSGTDYYGTISGTMTRTSVRKISFEGTCTNFMSSQDYAITGFVESKAWEVIK